MHRVGIFLLVFFLTLCCSSLFSQDLQEGQAALEVGSFTKALEIFSELAKQNDKSAQFLLGSMYEAGLGMKKDYHKAYYWIFLASNHDPHLEKYLNKIGERLTQTERKKIEQDCRIWLEKQNQNKSLKGKDAKGIN